MPVGKKRKKDEATGTSTLDQLNSSIQTNRDRLAAYGQSDPLDDSKILKTVGWALNNPVGRWVVGSPAAGFAMNVLNKADAIDAPVRTNAENLLRFGERVLNGDVGQADLAVLGTLNPAFDAANHSDPNDNQWMPDALRQAARTQEATEASAGYKNPRDEMSKAWEGNGDQQTFMNYMKEKFPGFVDKHPDLALLGAMGADAATSPTTYLSAGFSGATKESALRASEALDRALDWAKLADAGVDATEFTSRYADDALRISSGTARVKDLSPEATRYIERSLYKTSGENLAGTTREVGVPFLRKTDDGVGVGATFPWVQRNDAGALRPTLKQVGSTGERVTVPFGTRGADAGGLKVLGQTIIEPSEAAREFAMSNRDRLLGIPQVEKAMGLVSPTMRVMRGQRVLGDATGDIIEGDSNSLLRMWAKRHREDLGTAQNLSSVNALNKGLAVAKQIPDRKNQRLLTLAIADALPAEKRALRDRLIETIETAGRSQDDLVTSWVGEIADRARKVEYDDAVRVAQGRAGEDIIDHLKSAGIGEGITDRSRLSSDVLTGQAKRGTMPPEFQTYRSAGFKIRREGGMSEEDVIGRLREAFPGMYDDVETADDLWSRVDDALTYRKKHVPVGSREANRAVRAAEKADYSQMALRRAYDDPDAVRGELQSTIDAAVAANDEQAVNAAQQALDDFDSWKALNEPGIREWQARMSAQAAPSLEGAADDFLAGSSLDANAPGVDRELARAQADLDAVRQSGDRNAIARATTRLRRAEQTQQRKLIAELPSSVDSARTQLRDIGQYVDYNRIPTFLMDRGVDEQTARIMQDVAEQIDLELTAGVMGERGAGLRSPFLYGEQAQARGYLPSRQEPYETTWEAIRNKAGKILSTEQKPDETTLETLRRRAGELLTTEDRKAQDAVLGGEIGRTLPEDFDPNALRKRTTGTSMMPSSTRPKQPKQREYATQIERLGQGQLSTDLSAPRLVGHAVDKSGSNAAAARFENDFVAEFGSPLAKDAPIPHGEQVYTVIRDGKPQRYAVADEAIEFLHSLDRTFSTDESTNLFLRSFDRVQNLWKRSATSWRLAFHPRNMVSNYWLAYAEDVRLAKPAGWADSFEVFADSFLGDGTALYKHGGIEQTADEWMEAARRDQAIKEVYSRSQVDRVLDRELAAGELRDARNEMVRAGFGVLDPSKITRKGVSGLLNPSITGSDFGTFVEDAGHLAIYFNALDMGMDGKAAARLTDRVLYNYGSEALTTFERNYLKRAFPFYSWTRNNLPRMVETLAMRPGKMAEVARVQNAAYALRDDIDKDTVPAYMRDLGAIPLPGEGSGMINPALPFQDIGKLEPTLDSVTREVLSSSSPVYAGKPFVERFFNKEAFSGRDIENYPGDIKDMPGGAQLTESVLGGNPAWESLKSHLGIETVRNDNGETRLMGNAKDLYMLSQLSVFLTDINTLIDPGSDMGDYASKVAAIKIMPYDPENWKLSQAYEQKDVMDAELRRLREANLIPTYDEEQEAISNSDRLKRKRR